MAKFQLKVRSQGTPAAYNRQEENSAGQNHHCARLAQPCPGSPQNEQQEYGRCEDGECLEEISLGAIKPRGDPGPLQGLVAWPDRIGVADLRLEGEGRSADMNHPRIMAPKSVQASSGMTFSCSHDNRDDPGTDGEDAQQQG